MTSSKRLAARLFATATSAAEAAVAATKTSFRPVLYGFPTSSTTFIARFALHAREVPFEEVTLPIKLLPSGSPDALGKRPYLEHDGIKFDNTSAMIHHIDEVAHGDGFLPTDPVARAQVRALQEYCMTEVAPFGFYRIQRYLKDEMGATESQLLAWRMHWLHLGFKGINEMLETVPSGSPAAPGKYCVGDSVTMADLFIMPQVHWSQKRQKQPVDLDLYPALRDVYKSVLKTKAFQDALPERQVGTSFDWAP